MLNKKGQNIAEYAIVIALVIGAAIAMQTYVKRGLQGRVADTVDFAPELEVIQGIGEGKLDFTTKQYEPYYAKEAADIESEREYTEGITERSGITRTDVSESSTTKTGAYKTAEWTGEVR